MLTHPFSRRTAVGTAAVGLALARTGHVSARQAMSDATPEPDEKPVFLFVQTALLGRAVMNSDAGSPTANGTPVAGGGASYLLTLEGHSGQTIYFSDRPDRIVGAMPTEDFLENLGFTPVNPPNAALVAEFAVGDGVVVLKLINPTYDAETRTVTYGVELLEGFAGENLEPVTREQVEARLPAEFGSAALFIDDCPNYTGCSVEVCASVVVPGGEPEVYCWAESVGPIPTGPYKACFTPDKLSCTPCDTTLEKLTVMCNSAYLAVCEDRCVPS
ncbi:MAG: hypothetical protein AB7V46_06280 [Thermomicrobiales bacterium]